MARRDIFRIFLNKNGTGLEAHGLERKDIVATASFYSSLHLFVGEFFGSNLNWKIPADEKGVGEKFTELS